MVIKCLKFAKKIVIGDTSHLKILFIMKFYQKPLQELTDDEWEQICMRCGKCCMCKYSEDGVIHFSNQMCQFFDLKKGTCSCYDERFEIAKGGCKKVSMELLEHDLYLLPPSCAYRRLYEGQGLPSYHPLLTGDPKSVVEAGQTVRSLPVYSEQDEDNALRNIILVAVQKKWRAAKIRQKMSDIRKKFELRWLETYPI